MKLKILFLISTVLLYSCQSGSQKKDTFTIVETDERIVIPIDSDTKIYTRAMHHVVDNGVEYLTIENSESIDGYNTINFYRLDTRSLSHKVKIYKEGVNGIPRFSGHGVMDLDNIFLTAYGSSMLYQINKNGEIKRKYNFSVANDQRFTTETDFNSLVYKPLVIVNSKIYCMQYPIPPNADSKQLEKSPMAITIDTTDNEVTFLSLNYPALWKDNKGMGLNPHCSRIYDGKQFVYAFRVSENIITTRDHIQSKTFKIKSRYINNLNSEGLSRELSFNDFEKRADEQAVYGNILYDKYRKVYYRFAYPECELEKSSFEYIFCRNEFSIIIIDEDFNILGEKLFPSNKYVPGLFFINEKGLYVSENNVYNPDFTEDILSFRCLKLQEI